MFVCSNSCCPAVAQSLPKFGLNCFSKAKFDLPASSANLRDRVFWTHRRLDHDGACEFFSKFETNSSGSSNWALVTICDDVRTKLPSLCYTVEKLIQT